MPFRRHKPRKSGPMVRVDVVVMVHDSGGKYTEHLEHRDSRVGGGGPGDCVEHGREGNR